MAVIIIKSKSDLLEQTSNLRFKISKDSEWLYGTYSISRERFINSQTEYKHAGARYHWEWVYAYEYPTSGTGFDD